MTPQKNFPTPADRSEFEKEASLDGHCNFTRRGALYSVSELNTLAKGYCMGLARSAAAREQAARANAPATPLTSLLRSLHESDCQAGA